MNDDTQSAPTPPSPPSTISPRARMQELLAIPDRNRTDAEWDELNELEIALASGNRPGAPDPQSRQNHQRHNAGSGRNQPVNRPQGLNQNQNKNTGGGKKFHKRPKRRGGGGGSGSSSPQPQ